MTIDKIGGAANIQQKSNVRQNEKVSNIGSDRIDISKESKLAFAKRKTYIYNKERSRYKRRKGCGS